MTAPSRSAPTTPDPSPQERYRTAHERGRALAELCRLQISRVPCLVMVGTALAAGVGVVSVLAGFGLIGASCAIGAAMNDRADVTSDRLNRRVDRPLANGVLGRADVRGVVAAAAVVIAVSELFLPQPNGLLVAGAAAFVAWGSACEPLALQRRGLVGLVTLASGYLVLPVVLVIGIAQFPAILPLTLLGAGVIAHKDVRDEIGDRGAGKRTLLVQLGYRRMAWAAVVLGLTGTVLLSVGLGTGWWLVPAVVAITGLLLMAWAGHSPRVWLGARVALVVTAVLVGAQAASS